MLGNDAGDDLDIAQVAELPQLLGGTRVLEGDLVDVEGIHVAGSVAIDRVRQVFDKFAELLFVVRGDPLASRPPFGLGRHDVRLAVGPAPVDVQLCPSSASGVGLESPT